MITFKKIMQIIGLSVLVTGVAHSPAPAAAASGSTQSAQLPAIHIYLNNSPINTSAEGATLMNGTVMLSLDKLYVSGATISYDEHTRMITINNLFTTGSMKIGSRIATVNGKQITYSAAFQQVNMQLYIPLRFVNDAIGGTMDWNANKREAFISYPLQGIRN